MVVTTYLILFILAVIAITYPEDFPKLIRNPRLLSAVLGIETKRRWLLLKFGIMLFFERKRLQFSLWRAKDIIAAERAKKQKQKQQQQDTHD